MRDHADNVVVICSIENLDPMGVHTGESITVAPAQTLTDVEYQLMRDAAFACIRRIGVETGGSNVQFAVNPQTGEMVIIEMNPRVSRSSALASKATGFPIAKIAAKLAVGYRLDEVQNDITRETPASFEPTHRLRRHQVPALGVREAPRLQPGPRHPDAVGRRGHGDRPHLLRVAAEGRALARDGPARPQLRSGRARARPPLRRRARARGGRPHARSHLPARGRAPAVRVGRTPARGHRDRSLVPRPDPPDRRGARPAAPALGLGARDPGRLAAGQALGFSDAQLAYLWGVARGRRARARGSRPGCGSRTRPSTPARPSSPRFTPYHYSTYEDEDEIAPLDEARGRDPRQRTEPHRPGRRVRLLLRARRVRAPRRGLRDRHGQLQPRDRLDRLRHERSPLLRAAHHRRRAQRVSPAARGGRRAGRRREPRRPDAAEARAHARAQRHSRARHLARIDRRGRGPRAVQRAVRPPWHPAARRCDGDQRRRSRRGREHDRLPGAGPARRTCSAGARCRSSTTTPTCAARWPSSRTPARSDAKAGCRPNAPRSSTASWRTRPRSTSTRCATAPARS